MCAIIINPPPKDEGCGVPSATGAKPCRLRNSGESSSPLIATVTSKNNKKKTQNPLIILIFFSSWTFDLHLQRFLQLKAKGLWLWFSSVSEAVGFKQTISVFYIRFLFSPVKESGPTKDLVV